MMTSSTKHLGKGDVVVGKYYACETYYGTFVVLRYDGGGSFDCHQGWGGIRFILQETTPERVMAAPQIIAALKRFADEVVGYLSTIKACHGQ